MNRNAVATAIANKQTVSNNNVFIRCILLTELLL